MCRITKLISPTQFDTLLMPMEETLPQDSKSLSLTPPNEVPSTPSASMKCLCKAMSTRNMEIARKTDCEIKEKNEDLNYCYKVGTLLREGSYGEIRYATKISSDKSEQPVAIKVFNLQRIEKLAKNRNENPLREIEIQQSFDVNEKHIVPVIDTLQSTNNMYVVLPFYDGGDLLDLIETNVHGRLPIFQAKHMFYEVMKGIKCLHESYGVAHRDLSIENIFYDRGNNCFAIGDFGLSFHVPKDPFIGAYNSKVPKLSLSIVGKEGYIAPELWEISNCRFQEKGNKPADEDNTIDLFAVDVWACGVILFMSITGSAPMKRAVESDIYFQIICQEKRIFDLVGDVKNFITTEMVDDQLYEEEELIRAFEVVQSILNPNPTERPTVDELLDNPWFQSWRN